MKDAPYTLPSRTRAPSLVLERTMEAEPMQSTRFRLYTVAQLGEIVEAIPLVAGVLLRSTLVGIIAKYASFKSFLALDLALHIAVGLDWHGRTVTRGLVVYIYAEGASGIRKRVNAWRLLNQLPDVGGIYFLPQSVLLNDTRDCSALLKSIAKLPEQPIAIFVDTVARTFKGNESAAEDMNAYITACDRVKEATGATVILVHHMGWEGVRSRGASNLPGALDTEITLTRDGDRVTVTATKQKDGPEGEIIRLEGVPIGDSLALRGLVLSGAALSSNERRALTDVQGSTGLSSTAWMTASGLARGSFYNALNRLKDLAYVRAEGKKWHATEAGAQALSTSVQVSTTPSTVAPVPRSTNVHPSLIDGDVVLDAPNTTTRCSYCDVFPVAEVGMRCMQCRGMAA